VVARIPHRDGAGKAAERHFTRRAQLGSRGA
jgi:hypothetical protein